LHILQPCRVLGYRCTRSLDSGVAARTIDSKDPTVLRDRTNILLRKNITTSFEGNNPLELSIPSLTERKRGFVGATGLGILIYHRLACLHYSVLSLCCSRHHTG
jgi:hypothetical protein